MPYQQNVSEPIPARGNDIADSQVFKSVSQLTIIDVGIPPCLFKFSTELAYVG